MSEPAIQFNDPLATWTGVQATSPELLRGHLSTFFAPPLEGVYSYVPPRLSITSPCCQTLVTYTRLADIPSHDVPCNCGRGWMIRYTEPALG